MDFSNLRRSLACAAVAVGLGLSWGNAGAVVYSSVFDPPNFSGTATFDVSQACLDIGTGFATPGIGGCTVTWLTATVAFTDAPGLTFDYTALLPDSGVVSSIWIDDGDLAGVISGALGPVVISGSSNALFNGPWWIQYSFSPPDDLITALDGPPSSGQFGLGVVYLYTGTCTPTDLNGPLCVRNQTPSETANVESFTRVAQVPEPGTLVLILGAAAGLWFARRREGRSVSAA
jgi:PEP-CTERM motif